MIRVICILIGYACGLFQTSYIIGRVNGIDIRDFGSGNAGTTNTMRTLGRKAGLITFLGDVFKCVFAVSLVRIVFEAGYGGNMPLLVMYTTAGVVLGHNFPFYLNFRGGKGIAATAGLLISLHPVTGILGAAVFLTVLFTTHFVSLGSLLVYTGLVIEVIVLGQTGAFGMEQSYLNEMYIVVFLLAVLAFWKHRENIGRLRAGCERKTYLTKKSDM
mgnify:CR=1 FL=1